VGKRLQGCEVTGVPEGYVGAVAVEDVGRGACRYSVDHRCSGVCARSDLKEQRLYPPL
jgi:hypothetical protein